MGVVTLRLNAKEERILGILQEYLDEDKSKIFKEAMIEKFEDIRDREVIREFEQKEKGKKVKFESADALVKRLEKKYKRTV